jgi:hypothetical protein
MIELHGKRFAEKRNSIAKSPVRIATFWFSSFFRRLTFAREAPSTCEAQLDAAELGIVTLLHFAKALCSFARIWSVETQYLWYEMFSCALSPTTIGPRCPLLSV